MYTVEIADKSGRVYGPFNTKVQADKFAMDIVETICDAGGPGYAVQSRIIIQQLTSIHKVNFAELTEWAKDEWGYE